MNASQTQGAEHFAGITGCTQVFAIWLSTVICLINESRKPKRLQPLMHTCHVNDATAATLEMPAHTAPYAVQRKLADWTLGRLHWNYRKLQLA